MTVPELAGSALILMGVPFFVGGTVGLLRMPDIYTRLHSATKADNVGLGLVVAGLVVQADAWHEVVKLLLIWLLVLAAGAVSSHLIAQSAMRRNVSAWRKP